MSRPPIPLPRLPDGPTLPGPTDPLDALYSHKLNFSGGAPVIPVLIMEAPREIVFSPLGKMRLRARGGLEKVLEAPAGSTWRVRVASAEPAQLRYWAQAADLKVSDKEGLARARAEWEARGLPVRVMTIGTLSGIAGHVLDNRRHEVLVGEGGSEAEAKARIAELHRRHGAELNLFTEMTERAHGILEVLDSSGAVLASAQDLVEASLIDGTGFRVKAVEHGAGYSWHGFEDRSYRGRLELVVSSSGKLAVVNALPLEELLRGVVPSEIYASAPLEALKAQAVTARGEVLAKIGIRHLSDPYMLCSEQHCQVYKGMSGEAPSTNEAIAQSAGEALFAPNGGQLVDSVYSAVCGGHTEDKDAVWGGPKDPSLRGRPDIEGEVPPAFAGPIAPEAVPRFLGAELPGYCRLSSLSRPEKYRWERRFTEEELDALTQDLGVGHVVSLAVPERGSSGRAKSLLISGDQSATQLHGELTIRRRFKNLNSALFVVDHLPAASGAPGRWAFRGAGWGHGVGMCQVGAIGRAERGQDYRAILRHYYNGAEVVRIYSEPSLAGVNR